MNFDKSVTSVFVARQPIFDSANKLWGYELLFRGNMQSNVAQVDDPDFATLMVIADGFVVASEITPPSAKLLINFPDRLLANGTASVLPKDRCIPEILEDVVASPELIQAVQQIKNEGYLIAVDDFVGQEGAMPFIELADVIKVDVLEMSPDTLKVIVDNLLPRKALLLAEKVENREMFDLCLQLGFTLFQGYYFAKPQLIKGKKLVSGQVSRLRLLNVLSGEPDPDVIIQLISVDPALTYRLLRYINSSSFGLLRKVHSVAHAVTMLGQQAIQKWLVAVICADMAHTDTGQEVAYMAVARARFLEQLRLASDFCEESPDSMFLLGLLSYLDVLMGTSMEEIIEQLPLAEYLAEALLNKDKEVQPNTPAEALQLICAIERGEWEESLIVFQQRGISLDIVAYLVNDSMQWAHSIISSMNSPDGPDDTTEKKTKKAV